MTMDLVDPATIGFRADRLYRIDSFLEHHYLAAGKLPCAAVLVARHGRIAHITAQGYADVERQQKLTQDTIFRIYSMTKPLTALAFMMLVEEGKIALDDPVQRYIPAWKEMGVFAGGSVGAFRTRPPQRPMLVIDLLRHTSGLTYGFQHMSNVDAAYRAKKIGEIEKSGTLASMVTALATIPLEFSPGSKWNYSVSTDVVGHLIELVSGQSFDHFLHDRLLAPLGMVDTGFHVPPEKAHRLAACYETTAENSFKLQDDPATSPYLAPHSFISGGGGLVSTLADYHRFCQMVLNGGALDGIRYISRKTLALMTSNHLPGGVDLPSLSISLFSEAGYAGVGYGLGIGTTIDVAKTTIAGSRGDMFWGGMASTFFWADPSEELDVIFMTQLIPSSTYPLRRQLRTLVYAALDD